MCGSGKPELDTPGFDILSSVDTEIYISHSSLDSQSHKTLKLNGISRESAAWLFNLEVYSTARTKRSPLIICTVSRQNRNPYSAEQPEWWEYDSFCVMLNMWAIMGVGMGGQLTTRVF